MLSSEKIRKLSLLFLSGATAIAASAQEIASAEIPAIVAPVEEAPRYTTTREMKDDTRLSLLFLEKMHISQKKFAELDKNELIKTFFLTLDPSRTIFLQSDLEAMQERFAPSLEFFMEKGNLHVAFTIYTEFLKRLHERVEWTKDRMSRPFDLETRDDLFKFNRKDENWARTREDADALWEQRLTNDLINELLGAKKGDKADDVSGEDDSELEKFPPAKTPCAKPDLSPENIAAACKKIYDRYAKFEKNISLEPWEVEELFLNALTAQYDPHTTFFSKQSMEQFQITMRNSLCGIGALLYDDEGYCTIREILPGGPVERSGKFSVGDRIVAIGTGDSKELTDVVGMRLNKIVRILRGKKGEKIRLLVESASDHGMRTFITLTRDEIKLTEQLATAKIISVPAGKNSADASGENVPVGVITLPSFYGKDRTDKLAFSTSEDCRELLGKLKQQNVQAVILDLRNNGGGYLNEAIDLSELFLGSGEVVLQVKGAAGAPEILSTGKRNAFQAAKNLFSATLPEWNGPLIVLTTRLSASASEIVAGALRDNNRALVVGDPQTHGKGSVQEVIPFERYAQKQLASMKITRSKWYAPSGDSIQIKGVPADIVVPSIYSVMPVGEGDLERPLPWDSISSALPKEPAHPGWISAPISAELIKILGENSQKRQAELPEFLSLNRTIAWFENREGNKTVPLNIAKRLEERESDKSFGEMLKKEYAELAKTDFEATEIKLDSAIEQEKESEENSKKSALARRQSAPLPGTLPDDTEEWPEYDVVLREAARIAADWVNML